MDIIKAMISIFISFLFLTFVLRLAWPILLVIMMFILFTVIRVAFLNRSYRNNRTNTTDQSRNKDNTNKRSSSQTSTNPNVIDAEFTEEELD